MARIVKSVGLMLALASCSTVWSLSGGLEGEDQEAQAIAETHACLREGRILQLAPEMCIRHGGKVVERAPLGHEEEGDGDTTTPQPTANKDLYARVTVPLRPASKGKSCYREGQQLNVSQEVCRQIGGVTADARPIPATAPVPRAAKVESVVTIALPQSAAKPDDSKNDQDEKH